jgi:tRNA (pseudouridine54-N1)-methyltransferase
MFVRRFLVMFEKMPIEKASVKSGQNGPEVVTACRCVNIGLFVSGDIRRDVTVSLAIGSPNDLKAISFPGPSLRRVSPDERSISFFLLKAIEVLENLEVGKSFTMDNGIELTRSSLDVLTEAWEKEIIHVPSTNPERFILDANLSADRLQETP